MGKSRRTGGGFGSNPSGSQRSKAERLRDRYGTDRYPTAEDFIRAVEENPEAFDPESMDTRDFKNRRDAGGAGFGGSNLKPSGKSNWLADNPVDVDVDIDPGSLSLSQEVWNDGENSVDVVAGVDLVPLGVDINVNGDVGTIGVELGAPGDLFGVEGEISFDTTTGEVIGGGAGIELGGVNVSVNRTSHKGKTCTTVTVTYFGVGASYQNCQKDDEEPPEPPPPNEDDEIELPDPPPLPPIPPGYTGWLCPIRVIDVAYSRVSIYVNNLSWSITELGQQPYPSNYSFWESDGKITGKHTGEWHGVDSSQVQSSLNTVANGKVDFSAYYSFAVNPWLSSVSLDKNKATIINVTNADKWKFKTSSSRQTFPIYSYWQEMEDGSPYKEIPLSGSGCVFVTNYAPPPPGPPIPPENTNDMPDKCCNLEPVMSMLRKLNQALAVDEVIGPGLELPNEWILPTGKGRSKMKNYLEIAVFLAKMQDHLGVHPLTVQIADLNAGQEGNQEFKKYYPNGTKAIQEILTILHDENSDSADRLNLQMRLAVLNTRIFLTVASISRSLRGVFQFLGVPIREKREAVPLPFDFAFGLRKNKGFSNDAKKDGEELERNMKKLQEELNKNTENATEALLAKFLADSDQPIGYETFDPNLPDLLDRLKQLLDKK